MPEIPEHCPRCGGNIRPRPPLEASLATEGRKVFRCARGCREWSS